MFARYFALAAAVAVVAGAGCASAQQPGSAGGERRPSSAITVRQGNVRSLAEALGLGYSAQVVLGADGTPRAAEFPVIATVVDGSPAHAAGLATGDAIISVNGRDGREAGLFRDRRPGQRYVVRVRRGETVREVVLVTAPLARATP